MQNNRDRSGVDFREEKNLVNLPPKPCNIVLIILVVDHLYGGRKTRITTSCNLKNECLREKDLRFQSRSATDDARNMTMIPLEQTGRVKQPSYMLKFPANADTLCERFDRKRRAAILAAGSPGTPARSTPLRQGCRRNRQARMPALR